MKTWQCPDCKYLIVAPEEELLNKEPLISGKYTLHPSIHAVEFEGKTAALSKTEFAVFLELAKHPTHGYSAIAIAEILSDTMNKPWMEYPKPRSNAAVCVSNIRKKLGKNAITNMYACGYRLGQ